MGTAPTLQNDPRECACVRGAGSYCGAGQGKGSRPPAGGSAYAPGLNTLPRKFCCVAPMLIVPRTLIPSRSNW
jgi:hypothetical protein